MKRKPLLASGAFLLFLLFFSGSILAAGPNLRIGSVTQRQVSPEKKPILIDAVTVHGTTQRPARVTINGASDQDNNDDTHWNAQFKLDNGTGHQSLVADTGQAQEHVLAVQAALLEGSEEHFKRITLKFNGHTDDTASDETSSTDATNASSSLFGGCSITSAADHAKPPWIALLFLFIVCFNCWRRRRGK